MTTGKYIEIAIDQFGNVDAQAHGFNGVGCTEATSFIRALSGETSVENRPEYYRDELVQACVSN